MTIRFGIFPTCSPRRPTSWAWLQSCNCNLKCPYEDFVIYSNWPVYSSSSRESEKDDSLVGELPQKNRSIGLKTIYLQAKCRKYMLGLMTEVTRILTGIDQGDPHASEKLLPLVYSELRRLAAERIAREKPGQTLEATALVHEAYLRLVDTEAIPRWNSLIDTGAARGQSFAIGTER
jgi:hypothetical protein